MKNGFTFTLRLKIVQRYEEALGSNCKDIKRESVFFPIVIITLSIKGHPTAKIKHLDNKSRKCIFSIVITLIIEEHP